MMSLENITKRNFMLHDFERHFLRKSCSILSPSFTRSTMAWRYLTKHIRTTTVLRLTKCCCKVIATRRTILAFIYRVLFIYENSNVMYCFIYDFYWDVKEAETFQSSRCFGDIFQSIIRKRQNSSENPKSENYFHQYREN